MLCSDRWRSSPELFVEKFTPREDRSKESPDFPTEPAWNKLPPLNSLLPSFANSLGAANRVPVSAALLKNWAQLNPLASANSGCMAGTRFWVFSPYGRKDLAEEKPGDEAEGSVANGLSPDAEDVRPCACPKSGKASHKRTTSLHRTKVSDMRRNLLPPLLSALLLAAL
jgi:hypothetical protein